ncbi:hypothetical protein UFOVP181_46 [uncultured Caudovirales phage]|uniref:Uncharacterized protein n=1 Tax=uncultured Caudovirales phage TaxID=2100421 RepID=A0A6J5KZ57_9CAUD|nr:hypothetical protein UFOVP57_116 [uncultured Caudovirales phage]CAB5208490.1 hypothetical protein UFOVP181_46 [uncultured Caudovirales phage]
MFTLSLATLRYPRELCYLMERQGVKYYTYTFQTNDAVIKYGKAADNEWQFGTWGNRIYRQAGGIPGWNGNELSDTSAVKMNVQLREHFPNVTRDQVVITIYDYTSELEDLDQSEIDRILLNEEDALVKKHTEVYGSPPKLNIQKTRTRTKPLFDNLFEVA